MADRFTEADGHQLAADMLREVAQHWCDREEGVPDEEINDLWRRDNSVVLRRYLDTVKLKASPALEHGFFAVLTDFIGSSSDGAPDLKYYEKARAKP